MSHTIIGLDEKGSRLWPDEKKEIGVGITMGFSISI